MVYIAPMLSKSDRTKQLIVEKSAPIFNRKGYAATSMNDILQATGLAKGGVYGNFVSKDEIALAVFEFSNKQLMNAIAERIRQEKTATGKLIAIFNFYHNYSISPYLDGGCPLVNAAIDSDYNFPALKKRVAAASTQMLESLVHIINKGIQYQEYHEKVDAKAEATLIFSIIEGGMLMSRLQEDPSYLNKLLEYLKTHILTYHK
jgi:TetR/AcrR family transcriptional repressor of nem operon